MAAPCNTGSVLPNATVGATMASVPTWAASRKSTVKVFSTELAPRVPMATLAEVKVSLSAVTSFALAWFVAAPVRLNLAVVPEVLTSAALNPAGTPVYATPATTSPLLPAKVPPVSRTVIWLAMVPLLPADSRNWVPLVLMVMSVIVVAPFGGSLYK